MDNNELKKTLRKQYSDMRRGLDPVWKSEADALICKAIRSLPEYTCSERILLYSPVRNEIDLGSLFAFCNADGKKTAFPRCFGVNMRFAEASLDDLESGSYGIREPLLNAGYISGYSESDLCLLPCYAVNRKGYRLGYGGGYYDRFLTDFPGKKVAAVYRSFISETEFEDEFDIPADIIITEAGVFEL